MHFLSIFLPIVAIAAGVAAYLQYRNNPAQRIAEAGSEEGSGEDHAVGETVYQGLLWMKHKYEEERDRSTAKYMELKEKYEALREEYQKLQTAHAYTQELLNERQSTIDRLRDQLQQEALRTTEARGKLESSGHLLLQMHKELDLALVGANGSMPKGEGRPGEIHPREDEPQEAEPVETHSGQAQPGETDLDEVRPEETLVAAQESAEDKGLQEEGAKDKVRRVRVTRRNS